MLSPHAPLERQPSRHTRPRRPQLQLVARDARREASSQCLQMFAQLASQERRYSVPVTLGVLAPVVERAASHLNRLPVAARTHLLLVIVQTASQLGVGGVAQEEEGERAVVEEARDVQTDGVGAGKAKTPQHLFAQLRGSSRRKGDEQTVVDVADGNEAVTKQVEVGGERRVVQIDGTSRLDGSVGDDGERVPLGVHDVCLVGGTVDVIVGLRKRAKERRRCRWR